MPNWLKVTISVDAVCTALGMYLDWLLRYDGQNTLVLFPLLIPSLLLTPLNVVACLVCMIKQDDKKLSADAFWFVLCAANVASFFLPRFPR